MSLPRDPHQALAASRVTPQTAHPPGATSQGRAPPSCTPGEQPSSARPAVPVTSDGSSNKIHGQCGWQGRPWGLPAESGLKPPPGWLQQVPLSSPTLNTSRGGQGAGSRSLLTSGLEGRGRAGERTGRCPLGLPPTPPPRALVQVPSGPRREEVCEATEVSGSGEAGSLSPPPASLGPGHSTRLLRRPGDAAVTCLSLQAPARALPLSLGLPNSPGIAHVQGTLKATSLIHSTNTIRAEAALRQTQPRPHPQGAPVGREAADARDDRGLVWGGWPEPRQGRHDHRSGPRLPHALRTSLPPPCPCHVHICLPGPRGPSQVHLGSQPQHAALHVARHRSGTAEWGPSPAGPLSGLPLWPLAKLGHS